MSEPLRFVLYRKMFDEKIVRFAYEDRTVEALDDIVKELLGGEPKRSVFTPERNGMRVFTRQNYLLEVWAMPSAFQAGTLNGAVVGGFTYRRVATFKEVKDA